MIPPAFFVCCVHCKVPSRPAAAPAAVVSVVPVLGLHAGRGILVVNHDGYRVAVVSVTENKVFLYHRDVGTGVFGAEPIVVGNKDGAAGGGDGQLNFD